MTDPVTNELMYETLKAIRGENARTHERLDRVEMELRAIRGHMGALVQTDLVRDGDIASLTTRVERIERRLELNEGNG